MHENLKNIKVLFEDIKTKMHHNSIVKYSIVLLIFITYMGLSIHSFGAKDGLLISFLSWTFFVLCTPIADAGFLLDLPVRLVTGIRMIYSEIIVWIIAISANILIFFSNPTIYENTKLLSLFHHILSQPIPFWMIIILSAGGTFLSLLFGDELLDISYRHKKERTQHEKHKQKFKLILTITLFVIIFAIYDFLLRELGIHIPLIS